ncbi:MAG: tetratricopeptide repeat protein [Pseudomonadota bacterium]
MKCFISGLTKLTVASILVVSLVACGGAEERKAKYLEKGRVYLEDKNYSKARIEFKNVLQIDPKYSEAYFYLGQINEKNKELAKALADYKKAIELNPKYSEAKVKLSKIYVIAGTDEYIKKAKKLLGEVRLDQPSNVEAKLILATIEYKVGSKAEAKKQLELVVKEDKNLVEAVSLLSSVYLFEGMESKAIKTLEKGVVDNPKNFPLRLSLAKLLAKNNDYVNAEKYLKEAINIEPERYSLQVALSSFYASSNQMEKAESILRKSIEQDEDDAQRYLVLVEMLSSRVSLKKGDEELKAAIRNKPDLYELKFAQISFYQKIGKRQEAKEVLMQIIEDKSYDVEGVNARNQLAKYLLDGGDQKGAKKYIDEVIAEYPNNSEALLITSKLALANLDAIPAINGLRTVLKSDPKNTEAALLLAQAHELNNESELAENELKKSIEANPLSDQSHVNLARYLASKGRVDEAVSVVDKALTYFKESYDLMSMKLKVLSSQGKEAEAIALLNMMEQANTSKPEVNIIRGQYYLSKNNVPMAVAQFEEAYKKSQSKFKPLKLIVGTYASNGQYEKALERLQVNIDKNPNDSIANLLIGQVYLLQKRIPEAREKFIKASKAADSWLPPYTSLANSYLAEKKMNEALKVYQGSLSKLKNKTPVQLQMASIYESEKKFDKAMDVYQEILAVNKTNKLAANNYASLLLDYGEASDAAKALALSKDFKNLRQPAFQDTLGWAYAKTGDLVNAIEVLRPIVEKAPKIAIFRYHLGYALYQANDKAAAKSHLEIAVSSEQRFVGKDDAKTLLKSM